MKHSYRRNQTYAIFLVPKSKISRRGRTVRIKFGDLIEFYTYPRLSGAVGLMRNIRVTKTSPLRKTYGLAIYNQFLKYRLKISWPLKEINPSSSWPS